MADQYVFELNFKGWTIGPRQKRKENQFVIVDGSSMAEFAKLKEHLSNCIPEPFKVQYMDDEDDIVPIDTEVEFKEFAKLAKQRSIKGMLIKLILESSSLQEPTMKLSEAQETMRPKVLNKTWPRGVRAGSKKEKLMSAWLMKLHHQVEEEDQETRDSGATSSSRKGLPRSAYNSSEALQFTEDIKSTIIADLKKEILKEMRGQVKFVGAEVPPSEEKFFCNHKNLKFFNTPDANLSKKRKDGDANRKEKCDHKKRSDMEKVESKEKKLSEKVSRRTATNRGIVVDPRYGPPCIMSAIGINDYSYMTKRITMGKVFLHVWHVVNDGTLPWNKVELRHTWSSPGLEPEYLVMKCPLLNPGQEGPITVKFRAPSTVGAFISYWHFFFQVEAHQWQKFGHYVSLTGDTKLSKVPLPASVDILSELNDGSKKAKLDMKSANYSVNEEPMISTEEGQPGASVAEPKQLNSVEQVQMEAQKQLEASLLSSEIAAGMAREAANAAYRVAIAVSSTSTTPIKVAAGKPSELSKNIDEVLNTHMSQMNLADSRSDADVNNDNTEDNDPGFVMVDIPSAMTVDADIISEEKTNNDELNTSFKRAESEGISVIGGKEMNNQPPEKLDPLKTVEVYANLMAQMAQLVQQPEWQKGTLPPHVLSKKEACENMVKEFSQSSGWQVEAIKDSETATETQPLPATKAYQSNIEEAHGATSLPCLDPNINYPVFPPPRIDMPMYPQPVFSPLQHPNGFPSLIPHDLSSHMVFPPPTMHFTATKVNPSVQIPTYPPMPCTLVPVSTPPTMVQAHSSVTTGQATATEEMSPETDAKGTMFSAENPKTTLATDSTGMPSSATLTLTQTNESEASKNEQLGKTQTESKITMSDVQILPHALMDGAINVAANAYSTAWNALNNLRHKEGNATEFDPVFENHMATLVEMGFNNIERNARLLKRLNNDISQVIAVICATGGYHNLDID